MQCGGQVARNSQTVQAEVFFGSAMCIVLIHYIKNVTKVLDSRAKIELGDQTTSRVEETVIDERDYVSLRHVLEKPPESKSQRGK